VIVLIPAYQPDHRLARLVERLSCHRVLVVDDGSGTPYAQVFEAARLAGAEVITLTTNRGKGFALKTGFAHAAACYPGEDVVCADSDGQHRSRYGNAATRVLFRMITGLAVTDTQTGLRGYPARMLGWLGGVPGDRFEYELRLLLRAARERLPIEEVGIATVYLEGNRSSHFRPVIDSARIYGPLFAFAGSSLLAFAVDAALLAGMVALTGELATSAVTARLISATLNYSVNRSAVFGGAGRVPHRRALPRYAFLAAASLTANVLLLRYLTSATGSLAIGKVVTEVALFLAGFAVQRAFVFHRRPAAAGTPIATGRQPAGTRR
jgi:putative flippase GtrA